MDCSGLEMLMFLCEKGARSVETGLRLRRMSEKIIAEDEQSVWGDGVKIKATSR